MIFVNADCQRIVDLRQRFSREFDVDNVAEDLNDFTYGSHVFLTFLYVCDLLWF
jgi:hypothetical protein